MNSEYAKIMSTLQQIRQKTDFEPQVAIVLGSGLGAFAENIEVECTINYSELDGFPVSTVSGHAGRFVFGCLEGVRVAVMQGRVHYYEGYSINDVVLPVRLMGLMGAKTLFLTNAAGGINKSLKAGSLMLIGDHISSLVPSPLIGENIDELGTRFPDMSKVYDEELQNIVSACADELSISLSKGVYIQTTGPNYETPAEIHAYSMMGADAVGMSTACEAIAANHMGMRVCGISCISNMAAGINKTPLSHEDIKIVADKAGADFERLLIRCISAIK